MSGIVLGQDAARRIVRAVRAFERTATSGRGAKRRRIPANLAWSAYVRIAGVKVAITGTRARYVWVNVAAQTAEWKSIDASPAPDGIEIYDTLVNEIHIPRFG